MSVATEPKADEFFASRSGVCVYVNVRGQTVRVKFSAMDAQGSVAEASGPGAEEALAAARAALQKHQATLAPLFEKVARGRT